MMPTHAPLLWGQNSFPVPYAAAWSAEVPAVKGELIARPNGRGLAYRNEKPGDRDRHGVLWARLTEAPGEGRPNFRALHSVRQRNAMLNMLCQVCGGPASRTSRGWLFLLPSAAECEEGALVSKPPVCEPCAELAVRHCPHLTAPAAVRVRKPRVWGVFGGYFAPGRNGHPTPLRGDFSLAYGDPYTPWFLASQLVIELTRCEPERGDNAGRR